MALDTVVGFIGEEQDRQTVAQVLDHQATVKPYQDRAEFIAQLAHDHTALLLIDSTLEDWRYWVTAPKINPATRRIPIIVIVEQVENAAGVLLAGADDYLLRSEISNRLPEMFTQYARVLDPDVIEQLDCDCQGALPDLAQQGIEKFNAGEYYRQHDLFEALWVKTESPVRDLYRAVLQIGVAYYQIERGNRRGALKMLLRSIQWLNLLPDVCQSIDVEQLRKDSYRVRAELERLTDDDLTKFDRSLLKPVKQILNE